jgi:hypothetical protein
MGNTKSKQVMNPVNYDCPKCMEEGNKKMPNLAGRFFIINDIECQCNGCNTIYPKNKFYKSYNDDK